MYLCQEDGPEPMGCVCILNPRGGGFVCLSRLWVHTGDLGPPLWIPGTLHPVLMG